MVILRQFLAVLVLLAALPAAAQTFPELTGRVVDNAAILSTGTERSVTAKLAAHEQATGNQVVVVTVGSLHGRSIEEYGVALGRHWGIGQADRNNGVLLIVVPLDRKLRIEVGYGLEGDLTDATARHIIDREIVPSFRDGSYNEGVIRGVDAILGAIEGSYVPEPAHDGGIFWEGILITGFMILWVLGFFGILFFNIRAAIRGEGVSFGSSSSGGGFSGGSSGGFSGGGGSFGGGGSSGSW